MNGFFREERRLEPVCGDLFSVVREVLLAVVRILVNPVTEPRVEPRMRIPFLPTVPFSN
jgi:hypothetical protein